MHKWCARSLLMREYQPNPKQHLLSLCLAADAAPTAASARQRQRVTQALHSCRMRAQHGPGHSAPLLKEEKHILGLLQGRQHTNPACGHKPGGARPS